MAEKSDAVRDAREAAWRQVGIAQTPDARRGGLLTASYHEAFTLGWNARGEYDKEQIGRSGGK